MPLKVINNSVPRLVPGQVLERNGHKGTNPQAVILKVIRNGRWFKARVCSVEAGTVGPTTTTWLDAQLVGSNKGHKYKIIGVLCPQPKREQIIEGLDGKSFKVLAVAKGKCTVALYDTRTRKIAAEPSKEYLLDSTFWEHFKVFWPEEAMYSKRKKPKKPEGSTKRVV